MSVKLHRITTALRFVSILMEVSIVNATLDTFFPQTTERAMVGIDIYSLNFIDD